MYSLGMIAPLVQDRLCRPHTWVQFWAKGSNDRGLTMAVILIMWGVPLVLQPKPQLLRGDSCMGKKSISLVTAHAVLLLQQLAQDRTTVVAGGLLFKSRAVVYIVKCFLGKSDSVLSETFQAG